MFVVIAILLSVAVLGFMYHVSQVNESAYRRKYELVSELRQLVDFCRQHRSESHKILAHGKVPNEQIEHIENSLLTMSDQLIESASFENKSIFRILQSRIKKLLSGWQTMSVGQNQMAHGRAIRHCLCLIDEIILAWLIEKQRTDLSDEYNMNWQQIIEALEAVTRFRVTIQDAQTPSGYVRLKSHSTLLQRRIHQLALIDLQLLGSPDYSLIKHHLELITELDTLEYTQDQLYKISSDISFIIFDTYDKMLNEISETIYEPFPSLEPVG